MQTIYVVKIVRIYLKLPALRTMTLTEIVKSYAVSRIRGLEK